jgi:nucleoside-diphosphate-sugar epimerase
VIGELVDTIGALTGRPPRTEGSKAADVPTRLGDPSLLVSSTSFRPSMGLEQGLGEIVRSRREVG